MMDLIELKFDIGGLLENTVLEIAGPNNAISHDICCIHTS